MLRMILGSLLVSAGKGTLVVRLGTPDSLKRVMPKAGGFCRPYWASQPEE